MDSAALYYQKEIDSSIIVQARDLEARYGLLERDNQIKSLALANEASENIREKQRNAIVRICAGAVILGLLLVWVWRKKHYKRLIREESLRQQLLRGQIKSHFLFRSLQGLHAIIGKGTTDDITRFVQQLARLFQLSLENARQPFVPLKNELEALECYLQVQQTICSHPFDYRIDVKEVPDQEEILVPPMLLQPFAENAIVHGFTGQIGNGLITISIQKDHKTLQCVVEDNGRGFQDVEDQPHKRSLSTIINKERLEILSRQTRTRAQLKIIDKKATAGGAGVRVELILPYL